MKALFVLLAASVGLTVSLERAALAQPAQVRGKSLEIAVVETFNARRRSRPDRTRNMTRPWVLQIYFGTKGTTFTRVKGHTGTTGAVGTSGRSRAGGQRTIEWQGRRLVVTGSASRGGARRLLIDFSPRFDSCSAKLIFATRPGATWVSIRDEIEIWAPSFKGSVNACKVVSGNILR